MGILYGRAGRLTAQNGGSKRWFPARAEKVRCFYAELGHTVAPQADVYMTDLKPANLMLERIK